MTTPTSSDILAALNGQPTAKETTQDDATARALAGHPSRAQETQRRAESRAAGWDTSTPLGAGAPGANDWLARTAVEAAKASLRDAILTANPKATAGAAAVKVEQALEEAYTTAAEANADEYARLDKSAQILKANTEALQTLTGGNVNGK